MKGQGSGEYLIIIAVALIIAIIIIGMLGGNSSFSPSTLEKQSKSYWKGAYPFSIENAKITNDTNNAP